MELGHTERRRDCGETNATVNRKVRAAPRHGLVPVICGGEGRHDTVHGDALLRNQGVEALELEGVRPAELGQVVIA